MKGRLLTSDDLMKMEGQKVWVEASDFIKAGIHIVDVSTKRLLKGGAWWNIGYFNTPGVYEWIEDKPESRKYKTWEAIKMLEENPKLRFKSIMACKYLVSEEYFCSPVVQCKPKDETYNDLIFLNDYWEIVKPEPKPVSFMEAVKAYDDGKTIRVEVEGLVYYRYPKIDEVKAFRLDHIINGTWFVEVDAE